MKILFSYLLSASALSLLCAAPVPAVPIQAAEPAVHVGAPPPAADVAHWRTLVSVEGRFSIEMPSSYTLETSMLSKSKAVVQMYHCHIPGQSYIVQYIDKNPKIVQSLGPEKMLSIFGDAIVKVNHGSLISKRTLTLADYPGREVITKRQSSNIEVQRVYLVGNREYLLIATYSPAQTGTEPTDTDKESTNADRFLASFALLPAKLQTGN